MGRLSPSLRVGAAAGSLVLLLVLMGGLAWNAWDADRSHRLAAERTVRDYAAFAAAIAGGRARAGLETVGLYAFYRADLAEREGSVAPVPPSALAGNAPEASRCADSYPDGRWFARLGLRDGALDVVGPLEPSAREWLARELAAGSRALPAGASPYGLLFGDPADGTALVAYRVRRGPDGEPLEVHALAHCLDGREGPVFETALAEAGLLPPALVGEHPADSLLTLTVTDPHGRELFSSGASYASSFRGVRPSDARGPLEGLSVAVTLRPEAADRLVAGGIPLSRLPWTLALLGLAGALGAATLVQLRRSMALVRARERFVADVSHELRTPLQQLLLHVQLFRLGQLRDEAERAESLSVVERETHRLIQLVDRVLTFARAGSTAATRPLAVQGAVRESVEHYRPLAEAEGALLRFRGAAPEATVLADGGAVRQVLLNLLENAVKYGPPGQAIDVAVDADDDVVRITLDDEGPGIPPEDRERVFDAFYRLEREERAARAGSGIGLAIVRRLVGEMGGTVRIEEAAGGGTRAVVELPRVRGGRVERVGAPA